MTFKSTLQNTSSELVAKIEEMGSQFQTITSRETIMYQSMVFKRDLEKNIKTLAEMVSKPKLDTQELNDAIQDARYEAQDSYWDPAKTLPEKLHAVAYRSLSSPNKISSLDVRDVNTLGQSPKMQGNLLDTFTLSNLKEFRDTFYTPEKMVVVGVGVDHQKLVELVEKYLGLI